MHRLAELELCSRDRAVMSAPIQDMTRTMSAAAPTTEAHPKWLPAQAGRLL